jgi:choline kinase
MSKNSRVGVILAAGLGSRLRENLDGSPSKLLLEIEGESLLMRTIQSHEKAGIARIVIVTGWCSDLIKTEVQKRYKGTAELCFVFNEHYELSYGISLLKAGPHIQGDFLLTMADHVLDDGIMKDSIDQVPPEDGAILFVDYKIETVFDLQDATKVLARAGLVHRIGKDIEDYNCIDTGVFVGTNALLEEIDKKYTRDGDASLTDGVQALARRGKMMARDIGRCYWQDVDDINMATEAKSLLQRNGKDQH